jgi:hypothetical protein
MNIEFAHPTSRTALRPYNNKWLENFLSVYERLSVDNLSLLNNIYHDDVIFTDPILRIEGLEKLNAHFANLYENLSSCIFRIDNVIAEFDQAAIYWQMTYQHEKLSNGKPVVVYGNSHIKGDGDKVYYHRDYLDLGAMLYEQLPIFGKLTKWIKGKAAQ